MYGLLIFSVACNTVPEHAEELRMCEESVLCIS